MGLSATSLRIAMLTARKSSLEFEGQQINQQRLTLSNQTAAIFNSMLTMQVPTPPDPSEFSKMIYTFDKGNGLSQILNVARNSSGAYTHNVTYKGPKTDNVLMKKQLNNVGFKHENGQMSAVIDGLDYALTLNGNEDKLNEYLKTKNTYDNIKNVETQMQALNQMPLDQELSSSQAKQYFEALGLSSYETPSPGTVENVKTMDEAFRNVYNSGNYTEKEVTITYNSTSLPEGFKLDNQKDYMLTLNDDTLGTLEMNGDDKHYTYTLNTDGSDGTKYTITYNDEKHYWEYETTNATDNDLSSFGIAYKGTVLKYNVSTTPTETTMYASFEQDKGYSIQDYTYGDLTISNCSYKDGKWSYTAKPSGNISFKNGNTDVTITSGGTYDPDGKGCYRISGTYPNLTFTREEEVNRTTINNDDITSVYKLDCDSTTFSINNNIKEFKDKEFTKDPDDCFKCNSNINGIDIEYSINQTGMMTVITNDTDKIVFGFFAGNSGYQGKYNGGAYSFKQSPSDITSYWYDLNMQQIALKDDYSIYTGENQPNLSGKWVKVEKIGDKQWQYTYQLTDKDSSYIKQTKIYNGETYVCENGSDFTRTDDNGNIYILSIGEEGTSEISHQITVTKTLADVGLKAYYGSHELDASGKYYIENNDNHPDGIITTSCQIQDKYTYTHTNGNEVVEDYYYAGQNSKCSIGSTGLEVQKQGDGTYKLNGRNYPPNVCSSSFNKRTETQIINGVTYSVTNEFGENYTIKASFKAYVSSLNENEKYYDYDQEKHTLKHLITKEEVDEKINKATIAQMLLRNQNNQREENDKNITVKEMLGFFEEVLKQFGTFGSTSSYKIKLDNARNDYITSLDAKGIENPEDNQAIYNFIDANGNKAYLYVPLEYIKNDGFVDSTFAYMYEKTYLEGQNETISQKANIIYDENGRIVKITFDDGTVVLPEVKTEQDDEAYNAAMVKYDYEKQQYDKELQDCNAKTEIIAQQDKRLELKLKSIDTQHSALETEIQALNKVLETNVKSSFGSFSA